MQVEMWGRPMLVLSSCLQPQDRGHDSRALQCYKGTTLIPLHEGDCVTGWYCLAARLTLPPYTHSLLQGMSSPQATASFMAHSPPMEWSSPQPVWWLYTRASALHRLQEHLCLGAWGTACPPPPLPWLSAGSFLTTPLSVPCCVVFVLPSPGCPWGTTILVPCREGLRASGNMVQPWPPLIQQPCSTPLPKPGHLHLHVTPQKISCWVQRWRMAMGLPRWCDALPAHQPSAQRGELAWDGDASVAGHCSATTKPIWDSSPEGKGGIGGG